MRSINVIFSMVFALSGATTFATDNSVLTSAAQTAVQQTAAETQQTQSTAGTDAVRDTASPQNTINQAADKGRRSQNAGMMMNLIASAGLFAACAASCPSCRMELCAMGALAAAQAANQGQAADMSDLTFDASEFNPDVYNPNDGDVNTVDPASTPGSGDAVYTNPIIKEGMGKLAESGYKITEEGVTFPDGSFQPTSAFASPSAMVAAGMDPAAAQAAGDVLGAINSELEKISGASVASMAVDGGSGGYSAGGGGGGGSVDFSDLSAFALPKLKNPFDKADDKKLLAGKTVMVGGEPIGVKGDNIFDMVHRAYQKKRVKKQFFETSKGPARLPASLSQKGGI